MGELLMLLLVGLVIGILARLILPGRDPVGIIGTILVGVVGAIIGGYLWRALIGDTGGYEIIGGIIVAVLLLWIYRQFTVRRTYT